jgi:hypothetical protein
MRITNMKLINSEGCNSVDVSVNRLYTYLPLYGKMQVSDKFQRDGVSWKTYI